MITPKRRLMLSLIITASVAFAQPSGPTTPANLDTLQRVTSEQPENVEAWVNLGQAYLDAGRVNEAADAFLEAIALDYRAGNAHYGLGLAEFERGDFQKARFSFNEVTRLFPDRFDGLYNLAVTLAKLRDHEASAAAFREAIAQAEPEATDEDLISANIGLAGQLKLLQAYKEAADAYAAALEIAGDDLELAYLQADAQVKAGLGLQFLPEITALDARSNDPRVSALIATVYVEADQIDYALRSLARAQRLAQAAGQNAAESDILVQLGLLQDKLGREAEATRSFEEAVRLEPANWRAQYNAGRSQLQNGRPQAALASFNEAVSLEPQSAEAHLALASTYDQLGMADQALREATAVMRLVDNDLNPLSIEAKFITGRAQYLLGDFAVALVTLEEVLALQGSNGAVHLWAGLASYQLGAFDNAVRYYEQAVRLDPASVEARINLGAGYLAAERYRDAEMVYSLLVSEDPLDSESYYNLGWALLSQNRRDAARDAWRMAESLGYQPARSALQTYF